MEQKGDDSAFPSTARPTEKNMESQSQDLMEGKCWDYAKPRQSFFCCIFYSVLCVTIGLILYSINNPTFDQEYNNPVQVHITNATVESVTEFQFMKTYIKPSDRIIPTIWVYLVAILVPVLGYVSFRALNLHYDSNFRSKEWILDNDISFIKGFCIVFFLCYGVVSLIAGRISLPKPSAYEICNYDLLLEQCTKTDSETLANAWSSFPNADISFLVGEMVFFSLYLCNKLLMFVNKWLSQRYTSSLVNGVDGHPDFGEHRMLSSYVYILMLFGFIPSYIAIGMSITMVHDNVAYVWDLLGSCAIGVIMAWFTYGLFWDSPFDTMELGYTFELSGIPKNSHFYFEMMGKIRETASIVYVSGSNGNEQSSSGQLMGNDNLQSNNSDEAILSFAK